MGYIKKWIPPVIPLRDDLAVWKELFTDVHENLLNAGLVQTNTAGQLVIDNVSSLPADNTYAGFIEYAFNDALQATAPVVINLEYGCGMEGLFKLSISDWQSSRRSRCPFIKCRVRFKSEASNYPFACPQTILPTHATHTVENNTPGFSVLCYSPMRGFLGYVYGVGSRNKPFAKDGPLYGNYYGATFSLFVQRTTNAQGQPTGDGLALYYNGLDVSVDSAINLWADGMISAAYSQYLPSHSNSISRTYARRFPANLAVKVAGGQLLLEPIYYSAPKLIAHPYIFSYHNTQLAETDIIPVDVGGAELNFIALGNETSMSIDDYDAQRAGIIMLYDEN